MIRKTTKKATTAKKATAPKPKPKRTLPEAPRSPREANAWLRGEVHHPSKNWHRLCLQLARMAYGIPAKEATASDAKRAAEDFHKFTHEAAIPYGAFVFSHRPGAGNDDPGHVFVAGGYNKLGQRIYRGPDLKAEGEVDPFTLDTLRDSWGHTVDGWTDNINGYRVDLPKPPRTRK